MSCIISDKYTKEYQHFLFFPLPSLSPSLPLIWLHWTQFTFFLYYKLTIKIESQAEVAKNLVFLICSPAASFLSSSIHTPVTISALHTQLDPCYVQFTDIWKQRMSDFQPLITNLLNYMFSHPPTWLLPKVPTELKVYIIKTSWPYRSICGKTSNTGKFTKL